MSISEKQAKSNKKPSRETPGGVYVYYDAASKRVWQEDWWIMRTMTRLLEVNVGTIGSSHYLSRESWELYSLVHDVYPIFKTPRVNGSRRDQSFSTGSPADSASWIVLFEAAPTISRNPRTKVQLQLLRCFLLLLISTRVCLPRLRKSKNASLWMNIWRIFNFFIVTYTSMCYLTQNFSISKTGVCCMLHVRKKSPEIYVCI